MLICNFTDSYRKIDFSDTDDLRVIDLTDVKESTGYCSDEAAGIIRNRIRQENVRGIRYIDDGNHHYLSKLWMEKIVEPFDLCVFDHHTDMQAPGLLPLLSCGSWIRDSLNDLEYLRNVYLIGVPEDTALPDDIPSDRVSVIYEKDANTGEIFFPETSANLYLSVDLDVLSPDDFSSIWDQGSMTAAMLKEWIRHIRSCCNVIAEDYCG